MAQPVRYYARAFALWKRAKRSSTPCGKLSSKGSKADRRLHWTSKKSSRRQRTNCARERLVFAVDRHPRAKRDLVDIWLFTSDRGGGGQADRYVRHINDMIVELAANPGLGSDFGHVR